MASDFEVYDESDYLNLETRRAAAEDRAAASVVEAPVVVKPAKKKPGRKPKAVAAETKKAAAPTGPRWQVSLDCPTPLAHRSLTIDADDEEKAKRKFCDANGISDSEHPFTINRVS